jgi:hypothetical protein
MYDIYVKRKNKGLNYVQGRLKSGKSIVDLEIKYEKLDFDMILDESEDKLDCFHLMEVVDTDEAPPEAPLTRSHYFKYHEDFLLEFEISS